MALDETIAKHLEDYHLGESRAVTSRELERAFDIRGPDLRRIINRLRGEGHPICSFDYGYYYAETEEELQRTIRQLQSRMVNNPNFRDGVSPHLWEYNGKLEWYAYHPTSQDYQKLSTALNDYLDIFQEQVQTASTQPQWSQTMQ